MAFMSKCSFPAVSRFCWVFCFVIDEVSDIATDLTDWMAFEVFDVFFFFGVFSLDSNVDSCRILSFFYDFLSMYARTKLNLNFTYCEG